jgi:hypothetical protein
MTQEQKVERTLLKRALDWHAGYEQRSSHGRDALLIHLDDSKLWSAIVDLAAARAKARSRRARRRRLLRLARCASPTRSA